MVLEEAEGVDDAVGERGVEGGSAARTVSYKERGGAAGQRDEVDDVEAEGAGGCGVGDVEEADEGRGVVVVVDAGEETELGVVGGGVLDGSSLGGGITLGRVVELLHYGCYCSS